MLTQLRLGSQILMALLPRGGHVVSLVEFYADESYGGDEATGPLCLAAYLYEREEAISANKEWEEVLNDPDLPHALQFFRMSDCAHAMGVFRGLDDHCDRIARKMISIARERSMIGFAATIDQEAYKEIVQNSTGYPNPYTFLVRMCLGFVKNRIAQSDQEIRVNYMFEAGHKHRSDADRIMGEIANNSRRMTDYRYAGHSFINKTDVPIVQSADLLAWQTFTDFKRRERGEGPRRDYQALIRLDRDRVQRWKREELEQAAPLIWAYDDWVGPAE